MEKDKLNNSNYKALAIVQALSLFLTY